MGYRGIGDGFVCVVRLSLVCECEHDTRTSEEFLTGIILLSDSGYHDHESTRHCYVTTRVKPCIFSLTPACLTDQRHLHDWSLYHS